MYRIINLTNKDTDLRALSGLIDIVKAIGFSDILRLKHPISRLKVAFEVVEIILDNIVPAESKNKYFSIYQPKTEDGQESDAKPVDDDSWPTKFTDENNNSESSEGTEESSDENTDPTSSEDVEETNSYEDNGDFGDDFDIFGGLVEELEKESDDSDSSETSDSEDNSKKEDCSENCDVRAEDLFEKQKQFMNGEREVTAIPSEMNDIIQAVEEAKTEIISVGGDNDFHLGKIDCIVVNRLTKAFIESGVSGLCRGRTSFSVNGDAESELIKDYDLENF